MKHPGLLMLNTKLTGQDLGCVKDKTHIALLNKTVVMRAELILSTLLYTAVKPPTHDNGLNQ